MVDFNEWHLSVTMEIRTLVDSFKNEVNLIVIRALAQERKFIKSISDIAESEDRIARN